MPTYDYKCPDCDIVFEVTRSASDTSTVCCAECGIPAKRVFSPVGVVFKGSGFHSTDYRSKKSGAEGDKESKPGGGCPAKKDSPACDSCPAAS